jgi:putative protein kinase ArgK-like GTPase of G3E family
MKHQIEGTMHMSRPKIEGWTCPVHMISSQTGHNMDLIWEDTTRFKDTMGDYVREKRKAQLANSLWTYLGPMLTKKLKETPTPALASLKQELVNQRITPHAAAAGVFNSLFLK